MNRSKAGAVCALLMLSAAGAPAQDAAPPLKCAALLTADEVKAAVGVAMQDMGPEERNPGETECAWMVREKGEFKTVSVQFYTTAYITGGANPTPHAFYEDMVAFAEENNNTKRQALSGIGKAAAIVATDPQLLGVVQLEDGVARIVGNNLTKAQMTAVARAVATP
jgi:high-affinity K+ transport system ATPase subunit B